MRLLALAWALALVAPLAHAAPIYRCGQTYSQTPCSGGRLLESTDPRTAAQRAEARRITEHQRQLGERMENERPAREAREAASSPLKSTGFDAHAPAPAASVAAGKKKTGRPSVKPVAARVPAASTP